MHLESKAMLHFYNSKQEYLGARSVMSAAQPVYMIKRTKFNKPSISIFAVKTQQKHTDARHYSIVKYGAPKKSTYNLYTIS